MRNSRSVFSLLSIVFTSYVLAAPQDRSSKLGRDDCSFDSAESPNCWGAYSLDTNYYDDGPSTGVTREYFFEIQEGTAAFDGFSRDVMTVNGQFPGPTIEADWGDDIVVHVTNSVPNNGTSLHWHGVRQYLGNDHDGVASVTQCPLASGQSMTYKWHASQYGHSWYHSHYSLQAWNGVIGGIVIRGPATAPYDIDEGILVLSDWFHDTTDRLWQSVVRLGKPPGAQNGLINGTNVYGDSGNRFETSFTTGKRHRFRIVNTAMDTFFKFSIDNHNLTVIANDFVPIEPFTTDVLSIGVGQRYDVIVEADQPEGDYWMRAVPDTACSTENDSQDNIKGIVRYNQFSSSDPTSTAYDVTMDCLEPSSSLVPYLSLDVSSPAQTSEFDLGDNTSATTGIFTWSLNGQAFLGNWSSPTLQQVIDEDSEFEASENVYEVNQQQSFVYIVVQNDPNVPIAHPIHLHGHDFWVLAQGSDAVYTSDVSLELNNPPRRDVAMLASNGYLVIGFVTDNPGVWLLHCHIGWHASQGFSLQILERESEIADHVSASDIQDTCSAWEAYQAGDNKVFQQDSGI
ncbi:putative Multicopper oxidase [Seiridium unicorne]|uniref:Multicopper oxidase n=1 Tax=Seiridium unicorne TaxID=138068 RepID=A0ABR2UHS9_9PEZI